jgi:hypothetical protein
MFIAERMNVWCVQLSWPDRTAEQTVLCDVTTTQSVQSYRCLERTCFLNRLVCRDVWCATWRHNSSTPSTDSPLLLIKAGENFTWCSDVWCADIGSIGAAILLIDVHLFGFFLLLKIAAKKMVDVLVVFRVSCVFCEKSAVKVKKVKLLWISDVNGNVAVHVRQQCEW